MRAHKPFAVLFILLTDPNFSGIFLYYYYYFWTRSARLGMPTIAPHNVSVVDLDP
jgi:hypothetical protein